MMLVQRLDYFRPLFVRGQNEKAAQLSEFQIAAPLRAEREGFEPPVPLGTTVFKTVVIDHSTISPNSVWMTIAWFS